MDGRLMFCPNQKVSTKSHTSDLTPVRPWSGAGRSGLFPPRKVQAHVYLIEVFQDMNF